MNGWVCILIEYSLLRVCERVPQYGPFAFAGLKKSDWWRVLVLLYYRE